MHGLLSFFHVAVHHANVTVHDAAVLCRRLGILFGSLTDLDALNEQAYELRWGHLRLEQSQRGGDVHIFTLALHSVASDLAGQTDGSAAIC